MSFTEAIQSVLSQYATFSGRARRSEYWYFVLLNIIVSGVLGFLGNRFGTVFSVLAGLYSLAMLIPGLAVCVRRLHDTGRSGAWWFICLVPLAGAIILLVFMCQDSVHGTNEFGPSPKYPDTYNPGGYGGGSGPY